MPSSSMVRVYIHATCYSSYTLLRYLIERGLEPLVDVIDTSNPSSVDVPVLSVPWVTVGSRVAAADPVSGEEVELMVKGVYRPQVGDPLENFKEALLASSYASSVALLHGDVGYAAFRELVEASIRAPFTGLDAGSVVEVVRRDGRSLYEELEVKLARVVAINYVRDLYWASGGSLKVEELKVRADRVSILSWLIAKAGVGRVGLPGNPITMANRDGVELVSSIIEASGDKLVERVRREQEAILGDKSYMEFLKSRGFALKLNNPL